jgi:hypothetical protein
VTRMRVLVAASTEDRALFLHSVDAAGRLGLALLDVAGLRQVSTCSMRCRSACARLDGTLNVGDESSGGSSHVAGSAWPPPSCWIEPERSDVRSCVRLRTYQGSASAGLGRASARGSLLVIHDFGPLSFRRRRPDRSMCLRSAGERLGSFVTHARPNQTATREQVLKTCGEFDRPPSNSLNQTVTSCDETSTGL